MRIILFVEGDTEKFAVPEFLKRWLKGQLSTNIRVDAVCLKGVGNFLKHIENRVAANLNNPRSRETVVGIGLVDLYGFADFPNNTKSVAQKLQWARGEVTKRVDHPRFRMHFAVHETEAWLLSQPEILPAEVKNGIPKRPPEDINFDLPPAKLLQKLYDKCHRDYRKTVDGCDLFKKLDPNIARKKCPYLSKMMDDIVQLAREAGVS